MIRKLILILLFVFLLLHQVKAQKNNVYYNDVNNSYTFEYNGIDSNIKYLYTPKNGDLHDLKILFNNSIEYIPSNLGGPRFILNNKEYNPQNTNFSKLLLSENLVDNTLYTSFKWFTQDDSVYFNYSISIKEKTFILHVTSNDSKISGFVLSRSEDTFNGKIISIHGVHNVLYFDDIFTSIIFDWVSSSSSTIDNMNAIYSDKSFYFAQNAYYLNKTDGSRNKLDETIYLTVSPKIEDVLMDVRNPKSPYKDLLKNRIILDIWGSKGFTEDSNYIEKMKKFGIDDIFLIKHDWQKCGYDNCYPTVIPARSSLGGESSLQGLSQKAKSIGYLFGLHENYVDFYPNSDVWNQNDVALDSSGQSIKVWYNKGTKTQSYLMKPSIVLKYAQMYSSTIHNDYRTSGSFLDVHSATAPSNKLDLDANVQDSAKLSSTHNYYTQLFDYERNVHNGPVLGEGSGSTFYYWTGYIDGVEAQLPNAFSNPGEDTPLILDFYLNKIHPLMVNHGAGYYERFFNRKWSGYTDEEFDKYRSTEIALGNAGFIPSVFKPIQFTQVLKEYYMLNALQTLYTLANPEKILYSSTVSSNDLVDLSTAINSDNHFTQVYVKYDNGLELYVNRDFTSPIKNKAFNSLNYWSYNDVNITRDVYHSDPSSIWFKKSTSGMLSQTITIPKESTNTTFEFWQYADTNSISSNSGLIVTIKDNSSSSTLQQFKFVNSLPRTWQEYETDISQYAGKTISISFNIDSLDDIMLDDVVIKPTIPNWIVTVNGEQYTLPPNGWVASLPTENFLEYSALRDGSRVDYVSSQDYTFVDPRTNDLRTIKDVISNGPVAIKNQSIYMLNASKIYFKGNQLFSTSTPTDLTLEYKNWNKIYVTSSLPVTLTYTDIPDAWKLANGSLNVTGVHTYILDENYSRTQKINWQPGSITIQLESNIPYEIFYDGPISNFTSLTQNETSMNMTTLISTTTIVETTPTTTSIETTTSTLTQITTTVTNISNTIPIETLGIKIDLKTLIMVATLTLTFFIIGILSISKYFEKKQPERINYEDKQHPEEEVFEEEPKSDIVSDTMKEVLEPTVEEKPTEIVEPEEPVKQPEKTEDEIIEERMKSLSEKIVAMRNKLKELEDSK